MVKHIHRIIINSPQQENEINTFIYDFGSTKSIKLSISHGYLFVEAALQKKYDKQEMLSQNQYLFPDALKKALLIHLMLFSESITIQKIQVQIDNETDCVLDSDNGQASPLDSMVVGKLVHPFSVKWDNSSIDGILSQTKSTYDSRTAALFALLYSKCKHFESERFIYLWMAFNGMYNFFSYLISDVQGIKRITQEYKKIKCFQRLYQIGEQTISDDQEKKRIAHGVAALIERGLPTITQQYLESDSGKPFCDAIRALLFDSKDGKPLNLSPYGYLLTQFSYYYRCNLIHANKPLALFSYTDESDIRCLTVINSMLEQFIEHNLYLWFDDKYIDNHLRPAAGVVNPL